MNQIDGGSKIEYADLSSNFGTACAPSAHRFVTSVANGLSGTRTMDGVVTVLACAALPLVFAAQNRNEVSKQQLSTPAARTAQAVHVRRRVQHAVSGVGICLGYKWVITDKATALALLGLFCAIFFAVHQLRRRFHGVDELYLYLNRPLLRPREVEGGLPGAFWFLLGAAGAVAIFPRGIALQSILHLSVGDPVASVVGIWLGDRTRVLPAGKSFAGSLAAFVTCSISTLLLISSCCQPFRDESRCHRAFDDGSGAGGETSSSSIFGAFCACTGRSCSSSGGGHQRIPSLWAWFALLGGVSGAVGELVPLGVDDNLSMPIVSGGMFLALARCTVGGPSSWPWSWS